MKEHFHTYANLTEDGKFKDPIELREYRGEELPADVVLFQQFVNGEDPQQDQLIGFTTTWPGAGVFWDGNGILITNKDRYERKRNGHIPDTTT